MSKIFNVFSVFSSDDSFSTWKIETKICGNLSSFLTFFRTWDHWSWSVNKSWTGRTVLEFPDKERLPLHSEKEANFWGNINFYCPPLIRQRIRCNFPTIYSSFRYFCCHNRSKSRKIYLIARQNWMVFSSKTRHNNEE